MDSYDECSIFANALLSLRMGHREPFERPMEHSICAFAPVRTSNDPANRTALTSLWGGRENGDMLDKFQVDEGPRKKASTNTSVTSPESDFLLGLPPRFDKKASKVARGRYKCSLCGELKTNHICALVPDKIMCSVGTQSAPNGVVALSPQVREALSRTASADESCGATTISTCTSRTSKSSSLSSSSSAAGADIFRGIAPGHGGFGDYSPNLAASFDLSVPPFLSTGTGASTGTSAGLCNLSGNISWSFAASPAPKAVEHNPALMGTPNRTTSSNDTTVKPASSVAAFQERVITVTRNRGSINAPPTVASSAGKTISGTANSATDRGAFSSSNMDVEDSAPFMRSVAHTPVLFSIAEGVDMVCTPAEAAALPRAEYTQVSDPSSCGSSLSGVAEE